MLGNSIVFIILTALCGLCVIAAYRYLGDAGLYAWIAVATVTANILAASVGPMMGLRGVTLSNVPFATVFFANNIICLDPEKDHMKGVYTGLFSSLTFIAVMMLCSYLQPEPYDSVTEPIRFLFGFGSYNMCNTVASVVMYYLSNVLNVRLFLKRKDGAEERKLPVIGTLTSLFSNCAENFAFVLLGLYLLPNAVFKMFPGSIEPDLLMPLRDCITVALTTCVFEAVLSAVYMPLYYLVLRMRTEEKT